MAGAAAIIRPAAGSNIPEGLSSPACYCPLPEAGSVIGLGLMICLGRHAPTRPPLREESAAVAVAEVQRVSSEIKVGPGFRASLRGRG